MFTRVTVTIALTLTFLLPLGCRSSGDDHHAATEQMIRDQAAAWTSHNLDKTMSYFADNSVYESLPDHQTSRGKDSVRAYIKGVFDSFPDFKLDLTSVVASGDQAACEWVFSGTRTAAMGNMPATDKPYSVRGSSFFQIKDGKIVREVDYWDMMTFLSQIGMKPS